MGLPDILRNLGEKAVQFRSRGKVTVEKALDPQWAEVIEARGKSLLIRSFTDPETLETLGSLVASVGSLIQQQEEQVRSMEERGIHSPKNQHALSGLRSLMDQAGEMTWINREAALFYVSEDRKAVIEKESLLEVQRILTDRLRQEGISDHYKLGARKMLDTIEAHLNKDVLPTGENPK